MKLLIAFVALIISSCQAVPQVVDDGPLDDLSFRAEYDHTLDLIKEKSCECTGNKCTCCVHLKMEDIHLNDEVCTEVDYETEGETDAKIYFSDAVIYNQSLPVDNAKPVCLGAPNVPLLKLCALFYGRNFQENRFHSCLHFQVRVLGKPNNQQMACFLIEKGSNGHHAQMISF